MNSYPVVNFHFRVEWGGANIGFSKVSGLKAEHEILEYRTGADKEYSAKKIPGLKKFNNLILKRGVLEQDNDVFLWFNSIGISTERRDVVISLLNHEHEPTIVWKIKNAWPVSLKFSQLNAIKSEILIESLELAHEGYIVERV